MITFTTVLSGKSSCRLQVEVIERMQPVFDVFLSLLRIFIPAKVVKMSVKMTDELSKRSVNSHCPLTGRDFEPC